MRKRTITKDRIASFAKHLENEERKKETIEKYVREVCDFADFLGGRPAKKDEALRWKNYLVSGRLSPSTVNVKIAAINSFFLYSDWEDCRLKPLKVQKRVFCDDKKELTREEYVRLINAASLLGRKRLALLIEAICATGIRVGEVRYLTVEAAKAGRAEISMKGKIRVILIPRSLCKKLIRYSKDKKIASGEIFLTRDNKPMSRKLIWAQMKSVHEIAGVESSKVFPHNLRHLFARCFYNATKDIARLADVLGHSNVETTRIYQISTGIEHAKTIERLRLIS